MKKGGFRNRSEKNKLGGRVTKEIDFLNQEERFQFSYEINNEIVCG